MTGSTGNGDTTGTSDENLLITAAKRGDQDAFGALVRRYERLVFKIAGGFFRDRGEVEEIGQEAFLRAFQALQRFREGLPFGPWIARITVNLCYDRLRRLRTRREVSWQELDGEEQEAARRMAGRSSAEEGVAARDLAERLLQYLPVRDRQVLVLVEAFGYTPAEAATLMGSAGVVTRVRLHRARRRMRSLAAELLRAIPGDSPQIPKGPGDFPPDTR